MGGPNLLGELPIDIDADAEQSAFWCRGSALTENCLVLSWLSIGLHQVQAQTKIWLLSWRASWRSILRLYEWTWAKIQRYLPRFLNFISMKLSCRIYSTEPWRWQVAAWNADQAFPAVSWGVGLRPTSRGIHWKSFFLQISLICWALISYCVLITRSCQDVRDLVELTVAKMEMCPISIWSHAHLKNCWHISSWKHKFVEGTTWLGLWCWNALWSTTPKEEYVPAPRKPGIDFGKTLFADKYKTKAAHQPQLCLDLCAALSTGLVLAFCPIPSWTFKQQSKCDHRFHNVRSRDCCVF